MNRRLAMSAFRWSAWEEAELRVKISEAFDLRGTSYYLDALDDLEVWFERLPVRRCERALEERARARTRRTEHLIALLRETDPAHITRETHRAA